MLSTRYTDIYTLQVRASLGGGLCRVSWCAVPLEQLAGGGGLLRDLMVASVSQA